MSRMLDTSAWNLCWVPFTGSNSSVIASALVSVSVTIAASSAKAKSFLELKLKMRRRLRRYFLIVVVSNDNRMVSYRGC